MTSLRVDLSALTRDGQLQVHSRLMSRHRSDVGVGDWIDLQDMMGGNEVYRGVVMRLDEDVVLLDVDWETESVAHLRISVGQGDLSFSSNHSFYVVNNRLQPDAEAFDEECVAV